MRGIPRTRRGGRLYPNCIGGHLAIQVLTAYVILALCGPRVCTMAVGPATAMPCRASSLVVSRHRLVPSVEARAQRAVAAEPDVTRT